MEVIFYRFLQENEHPVKCIVVYNGFFCIKINVDIRNKFLDQFSKRMIRIGISLDFSESGVVDYELQCCRSRTHFACIHFCHKLFESRAFSVDFLTQPYKTLCHETGISYKLQNEVLDTSVLKTV